MNTILFVDDVPNILSGLKRTLRPLRHDWNVLVANDGEQALDILGSEPVDGVISDMRMPKMNGLELLAEVKKRHPEVVRIVLSGQADKNLIFEAIGVAHQFLLKPTPTETIIRVLNNIADFKKWMPHGAMKAKVAGLDTLPCSPDVYEKLMACLDTDFSSCSCFNTLFAGDIALSAKVLQLANSSFFAAEGAKIDSGEAAMHLGDEFLRRIAMADFTFKPLANPALQDILGTLVNYSRQVAETARHVALNAGLDEQQAHEAFQAGLLHNIGTLILITLRSQDFTDLFNRAAREKGRLPYYEKQAFGASHDAIGAALMSIWGLPATLVNSAAYHCDISGYNTTATTPGPVECLYIADKIVTTCLRGFDMHIDETWLARYGLSADFIEHQIRLAHENLRADARDGVLEDSPAPVREAS